jgi:hypothetical protein
VPAIATAAITTTTPSNVTHLPHDTAALARVAIAELVAFWAELPVDPIGPTRARAELLGALPGLRRLAEAVHA